MTDMQAINAMTLAELDMRMEAYELRQAGIEMQLAQQAWLNQQVKATKGKHNPRPYYRKFKDLYDYDTVIDSIKVKYSDSEQAVQPASTPNDLFQRRHDEFLELKAQGKIIPWSQRQNQDIRGQI